MIELAAGDALVDVDALHGGRIAQIAVAGRELLVGPGTTDDPLLWGCYPMAPWAGRLRDGELTVGGRVLRLERNLPPHAIHGVTHSARWDVLDEGPTHAELACALDWPLGGRAHQHLQLTPSAIVCVLTVVAGDEPMPAALGWHPWFRKPDAGDDLRFERMYVRGPDHLPTGEIGEPGPRPWDDCFTGPIGPPRLHHADGTTITITSDCDHWVVYDEPAHATCVEPQSAPPDAFTLAARGAVDGARLWLDAGEMLQRTMTIAWHHRA